jgi:hemerythrin
MALEWTENLSVGVELIDTQHRELIHRFGSLIDACHDRQAENKITELLAFLDDYVIFHFGEEQQLMVLYGFSGFESHRTEHDFFIRRLQALKQEVAAKGPTQAVVAQTVRFLLNWIVKHIKSVDVELGAFLKPRIAKD